MNSERRYESWGRLSCVPVAVLEPETAENAMPPLHSWLAFGNGRSYGDSCLTDGVLLDMRGSNRILSFSNETGILRAEAGILLGDILDRVVPLGWFLPVVPGTQFVTLGGAVANDIHGKNHHVAGTFGAHVLAFELLRTGGRRRICTRDDEAEWFRATIGGMGLTGLITWVELQLVRIESPWIAQETLPFASLDEFFALAEASDRDFTYSVAWIDSLATGRDLGRGVLFRGNHASARDSAGLTEHGTGRGLVLPVDPPFPLINRFSLALFNQAYRRAQASGPRQRMVPYRTFFFPLDRIRQWNRLYGPKGLRQFQCVLPLADACEAIAALLHCANDAKHASFLTVLKLFGGLQSPGLLSFPRKGATLTLDFAYRGAATDRLLADLDAITLRAGGAVNPYKDARMPAEVFAASFPNWHEIKPYLDPSARSRFSARVGLVPESPVRTP